VLNSVASDNATFCCVQSGLRWHVHSGRNRTRRYRTPRRSTSHAMPRWSRGPSAGGERPQSTCAPEYWCTSRGRSLGSAAGRPPRRRGVPRRVVSPPRALLRSASLPLNRRLTRTIGYVLRGRASVPGRGSGRGGAAEYRRGLPRSAVRPPCGCGVPSPVVSCRRPIPPGEEVGSRPLAFRVPPRTLVAQSRDCLRCP